MTKKYHRTKTEILIQFLQTACVHNGISITHLMYNTFVPHRQVKENLGLLVQNELVNYDIASRTYKTTEKGKEALDLYGELQQLTNATTEFKLI
jgi:predicted transcriptional regulator